MSFLCLPRQMGSITDQHTMIEEKNMAYFHSRWVLHPRHHLRMVWDGFLGALIVFSMNVIPLQMAFDTLNNSVDGDRLNIIGYVIGFLFACDVMLNCSTSYYSDEVRSIRVRGFQRPAISPYISNQPSSHI